MDTRSIYAIVLVTSILGTFISFSPNSIFAQVFVTELTGGDQPITTNTNAFGNITITGNNQSLLYNFHAEDLANVKHVGIHQGNSDEQGKVVVTLFETNNPTGVPIVDLSGNITSKDLKGPMTDSTIANMIGNMTEGNNYVNVQTSEFPLGEIRGQIAL
jgi:CHRD domain